MGKEAGLFQAYEELQTEHGGGKEHQCLGILWAAQ